MPIPTRSIASSDGDTFSLMSQATTTVGDSLSVHLVRKSARKGFTFNVMLVGPPGLGKTTLMSAMFGKNLEIAKEKHAPEDPLNPPVTVEAKTFEIDEKKVPLRLTVVKCHNYGEALRLKNTHVPVVNYIDLQFAEYHKRESKVDRRNIQDRMIHCLFFFISAVGHGMSKFDLEFLRSVHSRVNIIPIIARAEALTVQERIAFKRRVLQDLEKNDIQVYNMPDPDPEDTDDMKRGIKEIQDAMPFAVSSFNLKPDNSLADHCLNWGRIDVCNRDHSDFLLLKTMLHMQMPDLCEATHEVFYENYRLRQMETRD